MKSLAWGGRPYQRLRPLSEHRGYRCGSAPEQIYRTLAIGMGDGPQVMPPYLDLAERVVRPADIDAPTWRSKLDGKVAPEEVAALREYYRSLPRSTRRASCPRSAGPRGRAHLDIVSYVGGHDPIGQ